MLCNSNFISFYFYTFSRRDLYERNAHVIFAVTTVNIKSRSQFPGLVLGIFAGIFIEISPQHLCSRPHLIFQEQLHQLGIATLAHLHRCSPSIEFSIKNSLFQIDFLLSLNSSLRKSSLRCWNSEY